MYPARLCFVWTGIAIGFAVNLRRLKVGNCMEKTLSQLLTTVPESIGIRIYGNTDVYVTAPIVESSQDVQTGGVFVARQGQSVDGHNYIEDAIQRGAVAIVGEKAISGLSVPYIQANDAQVVTGLLAAAYHGFPSRKLIIIGVTGTDGKTTTSHILHHILKVSTKNKTGFISTIAANLGTSETDTGFHVTTPGAPQVQAYLAQMVEAGLTHCVLEMTSHGLAQGRLNGVDIDVAVLTNVTHEHLDYHGSWENYRDAKAIMFRMLAQSVQKDGQPKISVINADDPSCDYFAAIPTDKLVRYGIHNPADFRAKIIRYSPTETTFDAIIDNRVVGDRGVFSTKLVGEFNVYNILAAMSAAYHVGASVQAIHQGLSNVQSVSGRMERIDEGQDFTAIVDFAHTPNALKRALEAGRQMLSQDKKLFAVFGSAGLRDVEKRRLMAEVSAQVADMTVLTAEDPRTESLNDILEMMAEGCRSQGGVEGETFIRVPDRGEAIYRACQMANVGDLVMACGKGHEQSMCFGATEYLWDDRDAMRAALQGEPLSTLPTAKKDVH